MTLKFQQVSIDKVKVTAPYYISDPQDKKFAGKANIVPVVYYVRGNDRYSSRLVWVLLKHIKEECNNSRRYK